MKLLEFIDAVAAHCSKWPRQDAVLALAKIRREIAKDEPRFEELCENIELLVWFAALPVKALELDWFANEFERLQGFPDLLAEANAAMRAYDKRLAEIRKEALTQLSPKDRDELIRKSKFLDRFEAARGEWQSKARRLRISDFEKRLGRISDRVIARLQPELRKNLLHKAKFLRRYETAREDWFDKAARARLTCDWND